MFVEQTLEDLVRKMSNASSRSPFPIPTLAHKIRAAKLAGILDVCGHLDSALVPLALLKFKRMMAAQWMRFLLARIRLAPMDGASNPMT